MHCRSTVPGETRGESSWARRKQASKQARCCCHRCGCWDRAEVPRHCPRSGTTLAESLRLTHTPLPPPDDDSSRRRCSRASPTAD
ncbi:hypothetical protein COCVIDRAFT_91490 [Bipolaris victoriae FI3]|uniref:Uncharacterized protein n=1 Tax=Bipolaris victoriae (strain FI3) TaxID=930091 RepID=W7EVW6_BIPV3|nr:hypothetical protein COCVIDRAFT_91490 [Bipolaris victoriae FI3]